MRHFPEIISPKNKKKFPEYKYNRVLCYLRRDLYEHILENNENNYFDLDQFYRKYKYKNNTDVISKMTGQIIKELQQLGWKCKLSFGDTGLFIYSSDKPPPSCWNGDF